MVPVAPGGVVPTRWGARVLASQPRDQRRPPLGARLLLPLVIGGRWRPRGVERAVVGEQPCGIRDLDDERGADLVDVEDRTDASQVANGQATGTQDARGPQSPVGRQLVDEGQQVGHLLAGCGVDGRGVDRPFRSGPGWPARASGGCDHHAAPAQPRAAARAARPTARRRAGARTATGHRRRPGRASRRAGRRRAAPTQAGRGSREPQAGAAASESAMSVGRLRCTSAAAGPSPAGCGSTSPTVRTTRRPSGLRQTRARSHRSSSSGADGVHGLAEERNRARRVHRRAVLRRPPREPAGGPGRDRRYPLDAGAGARPRGERRQVGRGGSGQVRATPQQVGELGVGASPHVVGHRSDAGGRGLTVPGHRPTVVPMAEGPRIAVQTVLARSVG